MSPEIKKVLLLLYGGFVIGFLITTMVTSGFSWLLLMGLLLGVSLVHDGLFLSVASAPRPADPVDAT